jgi:hypothetical protein
LGLVGQEEVPDEQRIRQKYDEVPGLDDKEEV